MVHAPGIVDVTRDPNNVNGLFSTVRPVGAKTPTGDLQVSLDGVPVLTRPNAPGEFFLPVYLSPGVHTVVVNYSGDNIFEPGSG